MKLTAIRNQCCLRTAIDGVKFFTASPFVANKTDTHFYTMGEGIQIKSRTSQGGFFNGPIKIFFNNVAQVSTPIQFLTSTIARSAV